MHVPVFYILAVGISWQTQLPLWPFALPLWVTLFLFGVCAFLMVRLYQVQRVIASRGVVVGLLGLRLGLLALLLILVLRPTVVWEKKSTSAGTLYILTDRSLSMGTNDPQATGLERLRLADALGYLPRSARVGRPDVGLARVETLRQTFSNLRPATATAMEGPGDTAAIAGLADSLRRWQTHAQEVAKALESDELIKTQAGEPARQTLKNALDVLKQSLAAVEKAKTLREAAAEETVKWAVVQANLDSASRQLKELADRSDVDFLRLHGQESAIAGALGRVTSVARAELAFQALTTENRRGNLNMKELLPQYRAKVISFAEEAQAVPIADAAHVPDALRQALTPAGRATNISAGLEMVNQLSAGEKGGGAVVILSDGRQNLPQDAAETARLLAARDLKVYSLLVGSQEVSPDAAVEQPDAPEWIFRDDTVKVSAKIRMDGLQGQILRTEFLRDGKVLDTKAVTARTNQAMEPVEFSDKPGEPKVYQYEIRVAAVPAETNTLNNDQKFRVAVKKDKLAVLVVEDLPRWEYQFLVNYWDRDQSLKLQTVLLSPAAITGVTRPVALGLTKASPKNERRDAGLLPSTKEEWEAFDVIVMGDVPPEKMPPGQWQLIEAAVRDRGTTLVVIAGQRYMPGAYLGTGLANLLPVEMGGTPWAPDQVQRHLRGGFRPAVASEAGGSVLAQWGSDLQSSTEAWGQMPTWFWHSDRTQAKPSASVYWWIAEPGVGAAAANPQIRQRALLSSNSVGLGRVLFLASDQTWRLRNVGGEDLDSRFWGQVIRWAVGNDLPAGGRFVRFGTNRPQYTGEPVTVTIRMLREDLTPYTGQSVQVAAAQVPASGPRQPIGTTSAIEQVEAPGYYRATFPSLPAGTIEISLQGAPAERLLSDDPTATQKTLMIEVTPQVNLEERDMNTNWPTMLAIAQAGGGVALPVAYSDVLAESIPQLEQTYTTTEQLGFFTDPKDPNTGRTHWIFLGLFAGLITLEWAMRKRAGMI